jgi:hypothetical protein
MLASETPKMRGESSIAMVSNLYFNLFSVLQILDDNFEVRFKKGLSRVLDCKKDLVCQISLFGRLF